MRLNLERLEDRNSPSDLTALGVEAAVAYPVYGPAPPTYDTQSPLPVPYFTPTPGVVIVLPPDYGPPPPANPNLTPEDLLR